jgi:transglutaminase-like putative cysteine protease
VTYNVTHVTTYRYASPASHSQNDVSLIPRTTRLQTLHDQTWSVQPEPQHQRDHRDYFGNAWRSFAFEHPHKELRIEVASSVSVNDQRADPGDGSTGGWEPFVHPSPFVPVAPAYAAYAQPFFPTGGDRLAGLRSFTEQMFSDFTYDTEATEVSTPVKEFFRMRRGVCQDYAHLALACLRSLGIPARYVSGYLNTQPPPGKEKVLGADASHAWLAAWCPPFGWVDIDPTNGVLASSGHVTLAWGRDYGDVPPLRGVVLGGGGATLTVEVSVIEQR